MQQKKGFALIYDRLLNIMFILACVFSVGLVLSALGIHGSNENYSAQYRYENLQQGWYTLQDGQATPVTLPFETPAEGESITLCYDIPAQSPDGRGILFSNRRQAVAVALNNETIYEINTTPLSGILMASCHNLVRLPDDARGGTIAITLYNTGAVPNYQLDEVLYGNVFELQNWFRERDSITQINVTALGVLFLILLIATVSFQFRQFSDHRTLSLTCFALVAIAWAYCDSSFSMLMGMSGELSAFVCYVGIMALPIPIMYFIAQSYSSMYWPLQALKAWGFLNLIIQCFLAMAGVRRLDQMLVFTHVYMVAALVVGFAAVILGIVRGGEMRRWFVGMSLGFIAMGAVSVAALIMFWNGRMISYRGVMLTGISCFYADLLAVLVLSTADERRRRTNEVAQLKVFEKLSLIDTLTGLSNRRQFEADLEELRSRPARYPTAVLVMMDLNGLKYTNDHFGHSMGDELICAAGTCIRECFGQYGSCYRIGGDEFAVLMKQFDGDLEAVYDNLRNSIRVYNARAICMLSIAYGEASLRLSDGTFQSIDAWKQAADLKMYEQKRMSYLSRDDSEEKPPQQQ